MHYSIITRKGWSAPLSRVHLYFGSGSTSWRNTTRAPAGNGPATAVSFRPLLLRRSLFVSSTDGGGTGTWSPPAATDSNEQPRRQQQIKANNDRRIARALYRELNRWCRSLQRDADFPDKLLAHAIPPAYLVAPEQVDPYRCELLWAQSGTKVGEEDSDTTNTATSTSTSSGSMDPGLDARIVRRVREHMLPRDTEYARQSITAPIRSATDLLGIVRAVFRINQEVELPDRTNDRAAHDQVQEYRKKRRDFAFEMVRSLNALKAGGIRIMKEQHLLNRNHDDVAFCIGQVVQHRQERWRGVVIAWDKLNSSSAAAASAAGSVLSDDFSTVGRKTSLTTKEYGSSSSSSSSAGKTPVVVRYKCLVDFVDTHTLDLSSTPSSGWSAVLQSDLEAVSEPRLCRVRNKLIPELFVGFNVETLRFAPNDTKAFQFPSPEDTVPPPLVSPETIVVCNDIVEGVQCFATNLQELLLKTAKDATRLQSSTIFTDLQKQIHELVTGNVVPSRYRFADVPLTTRGAQHIRVLINLSHGVFQTMSQRRAILKNKDRMRYKLGDVVRHTIYNFRGVVVGLDPTPSVDVSRWDGLRDIENPMELPFYQIIPDQNDCIAAFGGERWLRYVCEENLEYCPKDLLQTMQVDMDPGWEQRSHDGAFVAPDGVRFRYGEESEIFDEFERCLCALEDTINAWQVQCRELCVGDEDKILRKLSLSNMMILLKTVTNMDDASLLEEAIKEVRKANSNLALRHRLEDGVSALVCGKRRNARSIWKSVVTDDPSYAEGWNKLATCDFMTGKYAEALESTQIVLELDPMHYQALNELGLIHLEAKRYNEAADCFRKAIDLDPWSPAQSKLLVCLDLLRKEVTEKQAL